MKPDSLAKRINGEKGGARKNVTGGVPKEK